MVKKPIKEQTNECQADRATLPYTHLLKSGLSSCASSLHGERPTTQIDGRQHPGAHPNALQLAPQRMMLDSVIGLPKFQNKTRSPKGHTELIGPDCSSAN